MGKLLYIQASSRGKRSHSSAMAEEFLSAYREANPGDEVVTLNVFEADLPSFDGLAVLAKYTILHGKEHSAEEQDAWRAVEAVIAEFVAADKYVLSVPMWNFGIPYRLKQYVDILVQPGYTFSYSPEAGYEGLVTGKKAFVAYARGGAYAGGTEAAAFDLQKAYLELILGFIGLTEIDSVSVEPTLMEGPEVAAGSKAEAARRARRPVRPSEPARLGQRVDSVQSSGRDTNAGRVSSMSWSTVNERESV